MTARDTNTSENPSTDTSASDTQITVPDYLGQQIEDRLPETDFDSVDEYVVFVLGAVLHEIDETDENGDDPAFADGSEAAQSDDEAVQDRLESLGYL